VHLLLSHLTSLFRRRHRHQSAFHGITPRAAALGYITTHCIPMARAMVCKNLRATNLFFDEEQKIQNKGKIL
jgi:hypothetical protein